MSGGLTPSDAWVPPPLPPSDDAPKEPRGGVVRSALQAAVVLAVFAAGGVAAGWLWEAWWTPPTGLAVNHRFFLDDQGLQQDFSATGYYVLVALGTGLALGSLTAAVFRRRAVVTLVSVAVGAGLAAWLMARTGHALGPVDPAVAARDLQDWEPLVGDLRVVGRSPYLVLPAAALAGLVVTYLVWPPESTGSPVLVRDDDSLGRLAD